MGFTGTNTAVAYFRRLMADSNGVPTEVVTNQLVADLTPEMLSGSGVPAATSAVQFVALNNAWSVACWCPGERVLPV